VPNRTTTVFDIASISKQFAAFAIAMLAGEGALGLDDDVRSHIPELADFGQTITIRHLVHHTSGLRDWPGTLRMAGWDYMDVMSFEQILEMAFQQRELNFPPGSDYAYSNTGYNLLAEIVSRVTGQSFRDWTRERIFEPLGMRQTHFHDDWTEVVPDRAESYRPAGDDGVRRVVSSLTAIGSSSLFTTVDDLALWLRNFRDPVVGGADLVAGVHERGILTGGDTIAYAFGLMVGEHRGARTVSHGGSWAGYRTTLLRFPDHGLDVVVLANTSAINAGAMGHRIADIYLGQALDPVPAPTPPSPASGARAEPYEPGAAELTAFAGEYRSGELHTSYRLEVVDGELVARHFRTGTTTFRPVAPDVFQAPTFGRVEFQRDHAGAVTGFTANSARIRGLRFDRVR
jgi:CubicO group peptidase (beta-lactamase class C family)